MPARERVAVGVSGGVDSSVAALLLLEAGCEVIGIFVKTWSPEWLPCTWIDEKRDAMRVCAKLGIPFYFLDASEEYKQGVADYMIAEYRAGRTPNPDVLCNKVIKFGAMWQYAQSLGATAIATGHYARTDGMALCKAADSAKDQSYFLWMVQQQELAHMKFPLGSLEKHDVRAIAAKSGLHTATKKDSQGICFLGDIDMREFLGHYIEEKRGDVVNAAGVVVGEHDGVWFYTLGERHGFRITEKGTDRTPYYVTGKDIDRNVLVVSHDKASQGENHHRHGQQRQRHVTLRDCNWHAPTSPEKHYTAQIRYHGEYLAARIVGDTLTIGYEKSIALGQSVVVYDGDIVIGGGIVDAVQ